MFPGISSQGQTKVGGVTGGTATSGGDSTFNFGSWSPPAYPGTVASTLGGSQGTNITIMVIAGVVAVGLIAFVFITHK